MHPWAWRVLIHFEMLLGQAGITPLERQTKREQNLQPPE